MINVKPSRADTASRSFWRAWAGVLGATLGLVALASLPPLLGPGARSVVMEAFAPVCHQMPSRSLHLAGVPLAVCHRCYGLYWGLPGAAFLFLALRRWDGALHRNARYVLAAAGAPLAIDWSSDVLGWWTNTPASRTLTGLVFGLAVGYYLTRAVVQWAKPARRPAADRQTSEAASL